MKRHSPFFPTSLVADTHAGGHGASTRILGSTVGQQRTSTNSNRTTRHGGRAVACLGLLGLLSGGCSFAFVDAPPSRHQELPYFECTSGQGWPTTDLVLGLIYGVGTAASLSNSSSSSSAGGLTTGVAAALFLASSYSGYGKTKECREAKDELILRVTRQPAGYAPGATFQPVPYDPWLTPHPGAFGKARPPQVPPAQPTPDEEGP